MPRIRFSLPDLHSRSSIRVFVHTCRCACWQARKKKRYALSLPGLYMLNLHSSPMTKSQGLCRTASCSGSSSANHSSSCTWVLMPSDGGIPDGRWRFRSPESGWVYGCTKDDGNVYVSGRVRGTSSSSARSAHTLTSGDSSSGTRKRDAYDRSHGPGPTR